MNNIDEFYNADPVAFAESYLDYLRLVLQSVDKNEVAKFIETLLDARECDRKIIFIGNGGSAATASHFANDLSFGTNDYIKPFRALSLTDNVPVLTALGNDYGYDEIFVRQLKVYANNDDVLVAISASGNSSNLVNAITYANSIGMKTVAITAFDGGKMKLISDESIHIPTGNKEYGPAEDVHLVLDHLVSSYLMRFIKSV